MPLSNGARAPSDLILRSLPVALVILLAQLLVSGCEPSVSRRIEESRAFLEAGRPGLAIETLREVLREDPDHAEANWLLGNALLANGEASLAIWSLDRARRTPSYSPAANRLLAAIFLEQGNPQNAVEAADRAIAIDSLDEVATALRLQGLLAMDRCQEALEEVDSNSAATPDGAVSLEIRGAALECLGREREALAAWRERWAQSADHERAAGWWLACTQVARLLEAQGEADAARATLAECLAEGPVTSEARLQVAALHRAAHRPEAAEQVLRDGLAVGSDDPGLARGIAVLQDERGEIESAKKTLEEIARRSGDPVHWREFAAYARANGDPGSAIDALQRVVDLRPRSGAADGARFELADLLIERGDLDRARALARELDDAAIREMIESAVLFRSGAYEQALAGFDRALRVWPGNVGARFMAGEAARHLGKSDRAMREYTEANRSDPIATPAADRLADLLLARGRAQDAFAVLSSSFERSAEVVGVDEARSDLAYRAGRIAHEMAREDLALEWLERCLETSPDHLKAANDLAWLLAERGQDLDRALSLAESAAARMPSTSTRDTLDFVRRARGK